MCYSLRTFLDCLSPTATRGCEFVNFYITFNSKYLSISPVTRISSLVFCEPGHFSHVGVFHLTHSPFFVRHSYMYVSVFLFLLLPLLSLSLCLTLYHRLVCVTCLCYCCVGVMDICLLRKILITFGKSVPRRC